MDKEWITIKEAAKLAGVSQQAIYKRLNTTLKEYVKEVENRKYLNIKALDHVSIIKFNQPKQKKKVEKTVEKKVELNETINKTIDLLQKQLEIKDKQIQDLNDRLEQALKNASQSNFLAAQEKQKMLEDPEEKKQSWIKRIFSR